jgi:hypothetical protein
MENYKEHVNSLRGQNADFLLLNLAYMQQPIGFKKNYIKNNNPCTIYLDYHLLTQPFITETAFSILFTLESALQFFSIVSSVAFS